MIDRLVRDVDVPQPPTIVPEAPTTDAARLLCRPDVPAAVVADESGVTGLLTESDIVAMVAETDALLDVGSVMSDPVPTVTPEMTLVETAETMRESGLGHLPVVEGTEYYGLVSADTLAPYLSRHRLDIEDASERTTVRVADAAEATAGD